MTCRPFTLTHKQLVAHKTWELTLQSKDDKPYVFTPGQHADLILSNGQSRTFSFARAPQPTSNSVSFIFRESASPFKQAIITDSSTASLLISSPIGYFRFPTNQDIPVVLLAGGVGIAPFRSMIEAEQENNANRAVTLFYSNPTRSDIAYFEELEQRHHASPQFTFVPTLTQETPSSWPYVTGRITSEVIRQYAPNFTTSIYYIAGPSDFVHAMLKTLHTLSVDDLQVKVEDFGDY